jgi:hypothetical protein
MNQFLTKGNVFTLINLMLLLVFGVALTYFFNNHELTLNQNVKYETAIAAVYIAISSIVALFMFLPKKLKINAAGLINSAIFLMLLSTILNVTASIIITVLFIICIIIYAIVHKKIQKPHPLFYFIAGYYIFQLIGLSWSIDFHNGLHTIDKGISFVIIPIAFCVYQISDLTRKSLLKLYFRAMLVFIITSIIGYIYQVYFNKVGLFAGFGFNKLYMNSKLEDIGSYYAVMRWSRYGHPTFVTFVLTLCFGIGVYFHDKEKESETRISVFELSIFAGLSMLLTVLLQSRLGMALFPIGAFIAVLWAFRKNKKSIFAIFGFATIMGLFGAMYIYKFHKNFFFDAPRSRMYELTQKFIHEHLWFGTGTGGMRKIVIEYANPHNQYYGEILHLGIVGALVMILLLGATLYFGIKNRNVLLLYFMILFLLLMLTEMPLTIQKGVTFFSLFVSLFIRPEWSKSYSTLNDKNEKLSVLSK